MTDETANCSKCGKPILLQRVTKAGIESEFRDDQGRCFNCNKSEGKKMGRKKKTETDERDPKVVAAQKAQESDRVSIKGPKGETLFEGTSQDLKDAAERIHSNGDSGDSDPDEPSNRKSIGYDHCPTEVSKMIEDAMNRWHPELSQARVEIRPLFALAYSRSGEAIPAIKVRGHAVLAKIKITSLEDRVRGLGDAKLLIDGARWERMGHNARLALLDHELEHLQVDEEELDDAGRPKLKMKHHDWEISGFDDVMKRQGENSIELQNVALLKERFAQLLIPFPDALLSAKLERIPPELLS
jgi:hypothetical protein